MRASSTESGRRAGTLVSASDDESQNGDPIVIRGVHKRFGDVEVLRDLNVSFKNNAITTILGPSGTGKSVLLKHILGLLEPDIGTVEVSGVDIWSLTEDEVYELRKRFGVLFQDGALFGSMSVFDNVAHPLRMHTEYSEEKITELVWERLGEVGLQEAADKEPGAISGGMRKRAGFARALIMNPDLVMFDEPDSGLDPVRTSLLNRLILQMHKQYGGTYVLVTHDIETARKVSDYVGMLWKGQLVYYGSLQGALESEDPFVRQFISGEEDGPLGMD
ncbi:phospholipid/cholesterol/gamma-HCH transport system ATP-binding protein [Haloechinothrix alba]|uniref:Phospholipid/cholesterol/gamma-HCH transport system ATP-binding protein n=1 Tax=Haloechinothrix alba TaxID=664784 RepID=A0A239A763_9PSEU|nr:ATP-binding cassette domain-containing protein [Haloechinothrix alba]SNR91475.1 phospholipid/cholesterol/gamma-HCH transport system ATP-binding protein [Haloechinothrix alba]